MSMSEENIANKTKKKAIVLGLLTVALVAGAVYYFWGRSADVVVKYKTIQVARGDLSITVLSTGTIAPENRLAIQSPVAGRVEKVLVDQGDSVKKEQILVWVSSTERAALLDGARGVGPEEVKKWEELYKPTPVFAPVSGMIIQRNVQPGQTFSTTDPILVMSDHLIVQVQVDETDLAQIQLKQEAKVVLDAYPDEAIPGTVKKIAYDAKTVSNVTTYEVDVLPKSVPRYMRSGMTANVSFPIGTRSGVLVVPSDAIKTKDGRPYVLLAPKNGQRESENREITLGISDGKRTEILTGLSEGDQILEPEFKLAGAKSIGSNPFSPSVRGGRK